MIPFLQCVARNYADRYADLSRFCFVFPSHRAATFFRKYLAGAIAGKTIVSPFTITMSELADTLSERIPDTRIDLLFTLYDAYRSLQPDASDKERKTGFDAFRMWGEVVLADFNEVDLWNVDADEIFKNVRDFREIETDYLTEEQRSVMDEYFGGAAPYKEAFDHFWKNYDYKSDKKEGREKRDTEIKQKFSLLWQTLAPLYAAFNRLLDERGLTYPGKAWKLALANVSEKGLEGKEFDKIVFVGLNALTKAEFMLLSQLKRMTVEIDSRREPVADFFWDSTPALLADEKSSAGRFVRRDVKHFPQPEWADMSECDASRSMPAIEVAASPSAALQTKLAGAYVSALDTKQVATDYANVAVVLPDENLVLPMLYSLPEKVHKVNLTMGFPLKLTSASSYVRLLRRLQLTKTFSTGETMYRAADLVRLFSHPFLLAMCPGAKVQNLKRHIIDLRKYRVSRAEAVAICPEAKELLEPLAGKATAAEAFSWIEAALEAAYKAIKRPKSKDELLSPSLDRDHIVFYGDAVRQISTALKQHSIDVNANTFLSLVERLLAGETVSFEGEPLEGLQVMGMLETRCLDFDHLIVLSVNERILPRRARTRSFIPAGMRRAYGMPYAGYDESLFAYYFYRMLGRAKTATLIYDARDNSPQTTPSRYILQLKHLYAKHHACFTDYSFMLESAKRTTMEVTKDSTCLDLLEPFKADADADKPKYFSSSSLTKYLDCPLKFYFNTLLGVDPPSDSVDGLDPIMEGNVVHNVMMQVYLPVHLRRQWLPAGHLIQAADIDRVLADEGALKKMVETEVNKELYGKNHPEKWNAELNPLIRMSADMLLRQVKDILNYDRSQTPFMLYGVEVPEKIRFDIGGGREVNMKCVIDRIDDISGKTDEAGQKLLRIVDYKTGTTHVSAATPDELFAGSYKAKHFYQLQLYANIHNRLMATDRPMAMAVYDVKAISSKGDKKKPLAIPTVNKKLLPDHLSEAGLNDGFLDAVSSTIREILDPGVPFRQTDEEKSCTYCTLKNYCMR